MAANVQSRYGIEVCCLFVAATYARMVGQLDEAMEKLRDANGQAYLYMNAIDVSLWAAPYMVAKRWGRMTSNIVIHQCCAQGRLVSILGRPTQRYLESYNGCLLQPSPRYPPEFRPTGSEIHQHHFTSVGKLSRSCATAPGRGLVYY
jgi:hypothetical protein